MRFRTFALSVVLTVGIAGLAPTAQGSVVDPADVQSFPRHQQSIPYPHVLLAASADYVLHDVHEVPTYDGHDHFTVLRTADGSTAWGDFDASADARAETLVGGYYVEKIGEATTWPTSVRFFDVETHQMAGDIPLPGNESLVAIGPGWILASRYGGDPRAVPGYFPVIHRLDGSSTEIPNVPIDRVPRYATDGSHAWVHDNSGNGLYDIDPDMGTATLIPRPPGVTWSGVLIGPSQVFNLEDQQNGHLRVTTTDRVTGGVATYDVADNTRRFLPLGDGLAAYQPVNEIEGTLSHVDLAAGTIGDPFAANLSDASPMGNGRIATVVEESAPGRIVVQDGTGATPLADLPRVSEGVDDLAYDGLVRATWGDATTWSIDPDNASAAWSDTGWTSHQRVTTAGGLKLVNDLDENQRPTTHWHLTWVDGARDVEASSIRLGHGGDLVVVQPVGVATLEIQHAKSGEVVATADAAGGAVADGSRVWTRTAPGVFTGVDVDHPDSPAETVTTSTSASLGDVRGRWVLVRAAEWKVLDVRQVVAPLGFPVDSQGFLATPRLGAGFVVWSRWTYDAFHHVNGRQTMVADLSPGHEAHELIDPDHGGFPTRYVVDEAGSPSLAYVDKAGQPKVLHLPWLTAAPWTLPDTTSPVLGAVDAPAALIRSSTPVTLHFSWDYSDPGTVPSPASGIESYEVRQALRTPPAGLGSWSVITSQAEATLEEPVQPGQELCAQSRATDSVGNQSPWSPLRCARVDGSAPVLAPASGSARFTVQDGQGGVWYRYHASDDDHVRSYDVQFRSAAKGAALRPWASLRRGTTNTLVRRPAEDGSAWCFRFRARDDAGNLSTWSPARCSALAVQDDAFYAPADALRIHSKLALDDYYLHLDYPGASLTLKQPQTGSHLALWVISGPGQGSGDVYVGATRVGRLSLSSTTWRRKLVVFPMPGTGVVRVVQRGPRPVGVDALAVER